MTMIIIDGRTKKNNIVVTKLNNTSYRISVFCVKGSGSSEVPGTPGNFLVIGQDNKPVDSLQKPTDFDPAGAGTSAVSSHLNSAPHHSALSEMTSDVSHRTVSDNQITAWTGNVHFKGYFATEIELRDSIPVANAGDYAFVDIGPDYDAILFVWDIDSGWIIGGGSSTAETDPVFSAWLLTNPFQPPLSFTPENVANKKTSLTDGENDYPNCPAVKTALAGKMTKLPVASEYIVTVKNASGDPNADIPTDEFWITNTDLITALLNAANWTGSTYTGTNTGAIEGQMYLGTTHLFIYKDSTFHRFAKV